QAVDAGRLEGNPIDHGNAGRRVLDRLLEAGGRYDERVQVDRLVLGRALSEGRNTGRQANDKPGRDTPEISAIGFFTYSVHYNVLKRVSVLRWLLGNRGH